MNSHILFLLCNLSFAFFFSFQKLHSQNDPKAKIILDKMKRYYEKNPAFTADFEYTRYDPIQNITDIFEGSILLKNNSYKINLQEQEIYNNEKYVWNYLKEENEVTITNYEPDPEDLSPTDILHIYEKEFQYVLLKEEKHIKNRIYQIIDLIPDNTNLNFYKIQLFIHKQKHTLFQWKIFEKTNIIYIYTIHNYHSKPELTNDEFSFNVNKYPNIEVVDLRE